MELILLGSVSIGFVIVVSIDTVQKRRKFLAQTKSVS